ncbi:MAG TPA: DUF1318 domain-containing protein [Polyangia bacterium]|jgi:hypothetical protein
MSRIAVALVIAALAAGSAGCIKAPEIVLVDRATALEEQAAGSYKPLEEKLARATMAPRPAPLTPAELETLGMATPTMVDDTERTDADRLDALLQQHCVGEGKEGLVVETHDACKGAADRAQSALLIDRTNNARQQLWRWMKERGKERSLDEVRRGWRGEHARGVVCGGWMQRDDGGWEGKKC